MVIITRRIRLQTKGEGDVVDITEQTENELSSAGVGNGVVVVFVLGSTAALTVMEYEKGLLRDLQAALERIAPKGAYYYHSEAWHDDNGHSHVRSLLIGPSLSIPFSDGEMALGRWQQIVLMEFDTRPRTRDVVIQIMGE